MKQGITLIIVDFQKDFCSETGSLYVKNAQEALKNIIKLLDSGNVENALFTVDWHPINHCSFVNNGGQWPMHCLQYSEGASIPDNLLYSCAKNNIPYQIIRKGTSENMEEYSAFSHITVDGTCYKIKSDNQEYLLDSNKPIVICGLAGDYCVFESVKSLYKLSPKIYFPGIAFIGNDSSLKVFMENHNLESY